MKKVTALRRIYLAGESCPISVKAIAGDNSPQHDGDLTDILHSHDFSELVIITEGCGTHRIDADDYPVAAGDIFVIQGRSSHCFRERRNLHMFNVMFDARKLDRHFVKMKEIAGFNALFLLEPACRRRHRFKSRLHISRQSLGYVESLAKRMNDEAKGRKPGHDTMMLAVFLELTVFLSREYATVEIPQAKSLCRLGGVIGELERKYRRIWSLDDIAGLACMSKSNLLAVFKEAAGCSPIEYLIRIRLQKAAELLASTTLSISEIAPECGFNDSNYLTRQFRRIHGISPREFRRKIPPTVPARPAS